MQTILIIEDEKSILDILAFNLSREGFATETALDGKAGLTKALSLSPDLILLDVMLPEMDGFEVLRHIREHNPIVPIVMLTAREELTDKVTGLELGADDYVTKPFSMRELLARVRANLRRGSAAEVPPPSDPDVISIGTLKVVPRSAEVYRDGAPCGLTQREFELILFLARARGQVFSREELMDKVWNYGAYGDARTVDVTVRRLREKVEPNPAEPEYILTRRGLGYMVTDNR